MRWMDLAIALLLLFAPVGVLAILAVWLDYYAEYRTKQRLEQEQWAKRIREWKKEPPPPPTTPQAAKLLMAQAPKKEDDDAEAS